MKLSWSKRVKLWKVKRLYRFYQLGIIADDLLNEVGCGFYTRSRDIVTVVDAVKKGKVTCPECNHIILRSKYYWYQRRQEQKKNHPEVSCSNCQLQLNWYEIRKKLRRTKARCFNCGKLMD